MNSSTASLLYFAAQALRGEPVLDVLRCLERSESLPCERLRTLQWHAQRRLLEHAVETVPFYRDALRAAGVVPADVRSPADWSRLPVLEKRDLQRESARLRSRRAPRGAPAITSGSYGTPVSVMRSHLSWAHGHANVFRGWRWHGLDLGGRHAYFWGVPNAGSERLRARLRDVLFNRVRASAFALEARQVRTLYGVLRQDHTTFAVGYPSALMRFAQQLCELGLDGRALGWRAVVCTAEVLRDDQRQLLGEIFGARVVDSYGCAEVGVAGFECDHGGMHVPVESVVVDLTSTPDGRTELLLTDLHNYSQPIIRYRVGDVVETAGQTACACGITLPVLGRIGGRSGDWIRLHDGRLLSPHVCTYLLKHYARTGLVYEYQFSQSSLGRLELRLVPGPGWGADARRQLQEEARRMLVSDIEVNEVSGIVRSGRGKHRDFVSSEDAV